MKRSLRRLWMAAVLLPVCLQGCGGGGGGSAGPGPSPQFPSPTVSAWTPGTSWIYSVVSTTGNGSTTRTVTITNPNLTNPADHQAVLEYRDVLGTGEVINDYYFRQDANGTVYMEGVVVGPTQAGGSSKSLFVNAPLANGGSAVVLYPSPMAFGQKIGPFTVTLFDPANPGQVNSPQTINLSVVSGPASVTLPIGPGGTNETLNTFVLQETNTSSSTTNGTTTTVTNNNLTYFVPSIGIVEISGNTETDTGPAGQPATSITENTILSRLTSTTMPH